MIPYESMDKLSKYATYLYEPLISVLEPQYY